MIFKLKIKQWTPYIVLATVVVVGGIWLWSNFTFQGKLWLDKMTGQCTPPPISHTIKVYSAGKLVGTYRGHFSVQQFDDHIVLLNHDERNDKTEIYGKTAVIVDED